MHHSDIWRIILLAVSDSCDKNVSANRAIDSDARKRCALPGASSRTSRLLVQLIGLCFSAVLGLSFVTGAPAATHENGSVRFSYPDTYTPSKEENTLLFTAPSGESLRVSVIVVRPGKEDAKPLDSALIEMKPKMERFGSRSGLVLVRPIAEGQHPTGTTMYTAASYSRTRDYYFLQYATAKPRTLVYFTFEGTGELDTATKTASEIVNSLEWR